MRPIDADDFKANVKKEVEKQLSDSIEDCLDARRIIGFIEFMLDKQSTIEPVKHGEWEGILQGEHEGYFRCSRCGVVGGAMIDVMQFTYCPNCGCKMYEDKVND